LLERYLSAAESIVERAIVIADPAKPTKNRLSGLRASFGAGEVLKGKGAGGAVVAYNKGDVLGTTTIEEGDYTIRIEAFGQQVGNKPVKPAIKVGDKTIKAFTLKADKQSAAVVLEAKARL